jgi:hypothetical protein
VGGGETRISGDVRLAVISVCREIFKVSTGHVCTNIQFWKNEISFLDSFLRTIRRALFNHFCVILKQGSLNDNNHKNPKYQERLIAKTRKGRPVKISFNFVAVHLGELVIQTMIRNHQNLITKNCLGTNALALTNVSLTV